MSYRFTSEEMAKLTDAQKDTIIEVVVGGVLADGKVAAEEQATFESELRKIPWGRSEADMIEKIKASVAKINAFDSPEKAVEFVKSVVAALPDQNVREKTFAALARVIYSDKEISENEGTVLMVFASEFGIPMDTVRKIGTAVKNGE